MNDQPNHESTDEKALPADTENRTGFWSSRRNRLLVIAGGVVLLFAGLWIWKAIEISNLKEQAEQEQAQTRQQASLQLQQANHHYLKLIAKPYVWAVRTEMMKGNLDAVNLYANDMVKEKNFQSIMVVDEKGTIVSSTDKKLEGKAYASVGKTAHTSTDSTLVEPVNENVLAVVSPVMGFNQRIGTLILYYAPAKASWQ